MPFFFFKSIFNMIASFLINEIKEKFIGINDVIFYYFSKNNLILNDKFLNDHI